MVKFNKFNVTNGTDKAKVHYSLDNRMDGRACVTIYAKDYSRALGRIFADSYVNETDTQTDYFDQGRVTLFADHPLYAAARVRAELNVAEWTAKIEAKRQQRREEQAAEIAASWIRRIQRNAAKV